MGYFEEMNLRLENENFPAFLQLWEEYKTNHEISVDETLKIFDKVKSSPYRELFGRYVEEALSLLDRLDQPERQGELLRLILDLQTTQSEILAQAALNYLTEKYQDTPLFKEKIRLVGLRSSDHFQGAIRNFELLTHMQKGKFIFHTGGWGAGEIMEISLIREQLSIEFENVTDVRELSFENAFKTLIPLSDDHFLSQRFGNPDKLEQKAKEDPVKVLKGLLLDLGPLNAQEIKEELYELVIPAEGWAKWWQATRAKAKKDAKIHVPKSMKEPFYVLEKEISFQDEFKKLLEKDLNVDAFLAQTYQYVKQYPQSLKNKENSTLFRDRLLHHLEESGSNERKVEIYLFLQEFFQEDVKAALTKLTLEISDLPYLVQSISASALKKKLLEVVKASKSDWKEIFADLFFSTPHHFIREYLLKELVKSKDEALVKKMIAQLIENPSMYPECFLWYFQKIQGDENKLPFADPQGRVLFFEALFILLHQVENHSEYAELAKKIHQQIVGKHFELYRENIANTTIDFAREILLLISKCQMFNSHDLKVFLSLAKVVHPTLEDDKGGRSDSFEEHTIWTTAEGYKKVQDRIHQIATVETVDNAKEIEVARSYGDLRENAEYKFAQERRARLQAEMKLLSSQLNQARIISPEDIDASQVSVGTIVSLVTESGKAALYTILGPWDADPEKNILSFQSQLAKAMMGHKVAESFDFKNDSYTIKEIKSYLRSS